ncbi:hypothetical protein K1719_029801 [Acacia pycnantha]|nr:hypothetical protein K1719_029801 [Acacia pycnantha]
MACKNQNCHRNCNCISFPPCLWYHSYRGGKTNNILLDNYFSVKVANFGLSSFGVVLIELIASMQAVDTSRPRYEINLANLAVNKIQKNAFEELIDPSLGFEIESKVLEISRRIESGNEECNDVVEEVDVKGAIGISLSGPLHSSSSPPSPNYDEIGLLKSIKSLLSPLAVTDKWHSESTKTFGSS